MAEDAKVDSGISSTTRSVKHLLALVHMAEDAEISKGDASDNEMDKRLYFKKSNILIRYLIWLRPDIDSALFEKRWAHLIVLTIINALSLRHHLKG